MISSHAAGAPGTVTEWMDVFGMDAELRSVTFRSLQTSSRLALAGDLPEPFKAWTFLVLAL